MLHLTTLRSNRRATNNRIRGPQSALTDFLASNNISAAQIRDDYERRRAAAQQQADPAPPTAENVVPEATGGDEQRVQAESSERKKRKRQEDKAIAKIKKSKDFKRQKSIKSGDLDGDEDETAFDMYSKAKPLPGQLENCELCGKRFTVTPYSKAGPDGGLLCTKCSKEQENEKNREKKLKKPALNKGKRRKVESERLEGIVRNGSKTLQELCVEKVAANINDVEEFGDLPESLLDRLSQIMSRKRVINARTADLLLRPDLNTIAIYDSANLEAEDYQKMFSIVPKVQDLSIRNAGQFKDEVIDYMLERNIIVQRLRLDAANLVSDKKWQDLFRRHGRHLESVALSWLDYSMDDRTINVLANCCPNVSRLKLKKCFKLTDSSLEAISIMKNLAHLSLRFKQPTTTKCIAGLIHGIGSNLRTLSLEGFESADDEILQTIHDTCIHLNKFRLSENDYCTDTGYVSLFTSWSNPPLAFIDLNSNRDLDYTNPDGPEEPVGLASNGFRALMKHSGSRIEHLDISSCRHITREALAEIFDGVKQYPCLKDVHINFLTRIDTPIMAGLFKSCKSLLKVTAFGCFNITDVTVPSGVALIGVPNAQESIVLEGDYMGAL